MYNIYSNGVYVCKILWFYLKKEQLRPEDCDDDDVYEEQPTVVVLKPGDLTAEEAAQAKEQLEKGKTIVNSS